MSNTLVKSTDFYKTFFRMTIVIALQGALSFGVNLADNMMLGAYSETALSGAAVVNQIQFLLQCTISGLASGIIVLGSQYWGKGETEPIGRIISVGLKFAFVMGLAFCLLTMFFPRQILGVLTNDEAVIDQGQRYLSLMCYTYLIYVLSNTLAMSLRCVQTTFIATVMSACTLVINVCLNYCLIFGNFGFPELGIYGAAIATTVSRAVELILVLLYVLFVDKKLHLKFLQLIKWDGTYLKDFIKVSAPVVASGAFWGIAQAAQTAILGHMSASVIAAGSIASVVSSICGVLGMASAQSTSVMMGKAIGAKQFDLIRPYTKTFQLLFLVIGLVSAVIMFVVKDLVIGFYAVSEETYDLAIAFMTMLSITVIGTCYEYPAESGIIQGGGNTKYTFICDTAFTWLFTIPLAYCAAFVWHLGPIYVFGALKIDQLIKCVPNGIYTNSYRWIRELTR